MFSLFCFLSSQNSITIQPGTERELTVSYSDVCVVNPTPFVGSYIEIKDEGKYEVLGGSGNSLFIARSSYFSIFVKNPTSTPQVLVYFFFNYMKGYDLYAVMNPTGRVLAGINGVIPLTNNQKVQLLVGSVYEGNFLLDYNITNVDKISLPDETDDTTFSGIGEKDFVNTVGATVSFKSQKIGCSSGFGIYQSEKVKKIATNTEDDGMKVLTNDNCVSVSSTSLQRCGITWAADKEYKECIESLDSIPKSIFAMIGIMVSLFVISLGTYIFTSVADIPRFKPLQEPFTGEELRIPYYGRETKSLKAIQEENKLAGSSDEYELPPTTTTLYSAKDAQQQQTVLVADQQQGFPVPVIQNDMYENDHGPVQSPYV